MVYETALDSYLKARATPRVVNDPKQDDLFQVEHDSIYTFERASDEFNDILAYSTEVDRRGTQNEHLPVTDLDIWRQHRLETHGKNLDLSCFTPRGEALETSLTVDQNNTETWKQPLLSAIPKNSTAFSIAFGRDDYNHNDFSRVKAHISPTIQFQRSYHLNSPLLPFSVETIKIPKDQYERLIQAGIGGYKKFTLSSDTSMDSLIEVPAAFVIGDGVTTTIEFKFPWRVPMMEGNKHYDIIDFRYEFANIHEDIIKYWRSLPILYAIDAEAQANCLLRFLKDLYGINIDLQVLDLKALAVSAGCRMDKMDMTTLCIAVRGILFPTGMENFDQRWALPQGNRPQEMKQYLQLKFSHICGIYRVLMGLLLRSTFPDPDIVLNVTEMTQDSFMSWFCDFVGQALVGADVSHTAFDNHTREEMIFALNPESILTQYLSQLMIEIPVAQAGGARFLHHARKCFLSQYDVFKNIRLPFSREDKPNQSKDLDVKESILMYERELSLRDNRNGESVTRPGLQPNPQFRDTIFHFNVDTDAVMKIYNQNHRSLVPALEEWARVNYSKIPDLFARLRPLRTNELTEFWIPRVRLYDKIRLIQLRVANSRESVEALDNVIIMKRNNIVNQYEEVERKRIQSYQNQVQATYHAAKEIVDQRHRVDLLSNEINYAGSADRVGIENNVLEMIPGNNADRNRRLSNKRHRRKMRKLNNKSNVIPAKLFKKHRQLRGLQARGLDVDAPDFPQSDVSSSIQYVDNAGKAVRFATSPEVRHSNDIDDTFAGPSTSSGPVVSILNTVPKDRHSSGYSTNSFSSYYDGSDISDINRVNSPDDLRFTLGNHRDLRDTINKREDLRDTIERNRDLRGSVDRNRDLNDALQWTTYPDHPSYYQQYYYH